MPLFLVDWPEPVRQAAAAVLRVANRKDYRISLISLNPLQVLDEEPFVMTWIEKVLEIRAKRQLLIELKFEPAGVLDPRSDNTQGLHRPISRVTEDYLDHTSDLIVTADRGFRSAWAEGNDFCQNWLGIPP